MDKKNSTQGNITSQNEILTKLRVNSENDCQAYKNEQNIDKEYKKMKNRIKKHTDKYTGK